MFSFLKSNGITQNPPAIEPIGRKAENWIKSILVVLYCVDKTTRYLLRGQKAQSFAAAQPLGSAAKAKMRSSRLKTLRFTLQQTENCGYQNCRRTGGKRLALT